MSICLLDTSVLVELLGVPNMNARHTDICKEMEQKIRGRESLFLPMATIIETGNHIAQNGDGNQRRAVADKFVKMLKCALDGKSPFTPINFPQHNDLEKWIENFPDDAMRQKSLGDLSIIYDWKRMCEIHSAKRVYIWSLDQHLTTCDRRQHDILRK